MSRFLPNQINTSRAGEVFHNFFIEDEKLKKLYEAVDNNNVKEVLELLKDCRIDDNYVNQIVEYDYWKSTTCLSLALTKYNRHTTVYIVDALLSKGAKLSKWLINFDDNIWFSDLELAVSTGDFTLVKTILDYERRRKHKPDESLWRALELCAEKIKCSIMFQHLIDHIGTLNGFDE